MSNFQYNEEKYSTKKVYFEGTDTLKTGYILCYNTDTTTDMGGTTVADGKQNEGKFLRVEKPKTANAFHVAGIVPASESGKIGPCWLTIIESDGHFVAVKSDANVTAEDILYVQNGSYLAGSSGVAAVGVAIETVDRSVTNGLVLIGANLVTSEEVIDVASIDVATSTNASTNVVQDASIDSLEVVDSANLSTEVADVASIDTVFSNLDSIGTAVGSADSALSTVGSQVVVILDALKSINV